MDDTYVEMYIPSNLQTRVVSSWTGKEWLQKRSLGMDVNNEDDVEDPIELEEREMNWSKSISQVLRYDVELESVWKSVSLQM